MTEREEEIRAFLASAGLSSARRVAIAQDASNRQYFRLCSSDGGQFILMDAPPDGNGPVSDFVKVADHLRKIGLSAPIIYHANENCGLLILEDFGDALFAELIKAKPENEGALYRLAVDVLLHLRTASMPDLAVADSDWMARMTAPAFDWYAGSRNGQDAFQDAFRKLATETDSAAPVLMLRDYHVENLILLSGRSGVLQAGLLDFQDAMLAHPAYDLVSILQDARRDIYLKLETEMREYYLMTTGDDRTRFERAYAIIGVQRNLRILGIFARLSLRDSKPNYVEMIPRVWGYLQRNLAHPDLSELHKLTREMLPAPTPAHLSRLRSQ